MSNKAHLTIGSVPDHLIKLALPTLIGIVCTFSYIIADTYFISLLGQSQLTAISYATPMIDFIIGIAIGIGISVSSIVARKIGANQFDQVRVYVLHAAMLCLIIAVIVIILGISFIGLIFRSLGADNQIISQIYNFMVIWYFGVFFLFMNFVSSSSLRAYGRAKGPAMILIITAILNVMLDPIFMFVLHLGIMGAAIAGLISSFLGFILLIRMLVKNSLISFEVKKYLPLLYNSWKNIIAITIPASLTNVIGPLASFWITYLLATSSQAAVAGFGVAAKAQMIAVIPLFAVSASIGPIVGQNYTANKIDRSFLALKICSVFAIVWGVLISIMLAIFAPYISQVFSDDPQTILSSNLYMYIIPISYTGWGVIMMVCANFNSLGYPKRSTFISFTRMIILFIPLSIILFHWFDYVGVYVAFSLATFITAIFAYLWAHKDYSKIKPGFINH